MRTRSLFVLVVVAASGCSSSNVNVDSGPRTANGSGAAMATAATTGSGGSTSSFGDPTSPNYSPPTAPTSDAAVCPPGEICHSGAVDEDDCGYQEITSEIETIEMPTNLLFVYDRSGSMTEAWGSSTKYQSASSAVVQALTPIQNLIVNVGSVFFPGEVPNPLICHDGSPICNQSDPIDSSNIVGCCHTSDLVIGAGCYVPPIAAVDQIPFTNPANFLGQLPQKSTPAQLFYFTPWEGGTIQANEAIQDALGAGTLFVANMNPPATGPSNPGDIPTDAAMPMLTGTDELVIIFVTDGEPNCGTDVANVESQIKAWFNQGFKTYVMGLPGATAGNTGAVDNLNSLAVAGGTTQYIDAADPMVLEQELHDIVLQNVQGGLASCDIQLGQPAAAPDKLRLIVTLQDGTEASMDKIDGDPDSWVLSADLMTVTLNGLLCDNAKAGTYPNLRFDFGCADIPPAPPPPVVVLQ